MAGAFEPVDYEFLVVRELVYKTKIKGHPFTTKSPDGRVVATLDADGLLTLFPGFGYNGASGPTIDKPVEVIEPAASRHDALYGGMSSGAVPQRFRAYVDRMFLDILLAEYKAYCDKEDREITRDECTNTGVFSRIKNSARTVALAAKRRFWVARAWTWYFFVGSFGASKSARPK